MLIFVRHGRTAANKAGKLQGRLDIDLDDFGQRQAAAVAEFVQSYGPVAEVIASPLKRAQQTAAAFGLPVETDERFIELSYGEYEGVLVSDVSAETWATWRGDVDFAPPGGESLATLDLRVRAACNDLVERAIESNVVVVSHVSPMKAAAAWALGVDIGISWNCNLDQAAVCRVAIRGNGSPVLASFNETVRLD